MFLYPGFRFIRDLTRLTFFFFNDTATTEIYTLSLHDALPIYTPLNKVPLLVVDPKVMLEQQAKWTKLYEELFVELRDRKSTRLNSSHSQISYAVFCLKKKKNSLSLPETVVVEAVACFQL